MPDARYRTTTIEQVEALPGPGTLTWHPLRAALDVRAFGINGYTASQAGEDVVEPHRESVHQEIYLVLAGSASFTVDGDSFEAPAGTFVFLPEPDADRQAVAREPGTTVLAIGGPPTYDPSAWEWYFRASAIRETDLAGAHAVLEEGLAEHPESGGMHYEMACQLALEGDAEAGADRAATHRRARPRPGRPRARGPRLRLAARAHGLPPARRARQGVGLAMAGIVLGPVLRYVGEDCATLWFELDAPCEVTVIAEDVVASVDTFHVTGHHYALVVLARPGARRDHPLHGRRRRRARLAAARRGAPRPGHPPGRPGRGGADAVRLLPGRAPPRAAVHALPRRRPVGLQPRRAARLRAADARPALRRRGRSSCSSAATRSTPTSSPP